MAQYLKKDSELGYVEDPAVIEYLKFNNMRHVALNCMLGDFDKDGNYVLSDEIKQELIQMKKYIVESMENIEVCRGELKLDKHISFIVTFESDKATLSLIEKMNYEANFKINSGSYSNMVEYVLDEVETSGEVNRNAIYSKWNIGEFDGVVVDIFNAEDSVLQKYFGIINRFKYLLKANEKLLETEKDVEKLEVEYALKVMDILSHYPKLLTAVEKHIKKTFTQKKDFVCIDRPNFAKTINEILDNAINANLSVLKDAEKVDFEAELRNIINELNIKRTDLGVGQLRDDIYSILTNPYASETIEGCAISFASISKIILEEYARYVYDEKKKDERNKLIFMLISMGILLEDMQAKELPQKLVVRAAEKQAEAKVDEAKAPATKPNVKKEEKKAVKKTAKKPEKTKKKEETAVKNNNPQKQEEVEKEKKQSPRYATMRNLEQSRKLEESTEVDGNMLRRVANARNSEVVNSAEQTDVVRRVNRTASSGTINDVDTGLTR